MKKFIFGFIFVVFSLSAYSQDQAELTHFLLHNTVRIQTESSQGIKTGTGFLYGFTEKDSKRIIPVLVTCWHMVSNSFAGRFYVSLLHSNVPPADDRIGYVFNGESNWIRHPDTNVDLAVMPIAPLFYLGHSNNMNIDLQVIGEEFVPDQNELRSYGVCQELKFIGYPNGIWDEKNNLPIVRRGMTATDPSIDYNGNPQFLMDAAVFPGSSGSPVYIVDAPASFRNSGFYANAQIKLLGIVDAVFLSDSEGQLKIVPIPSAYDAKINTQIPNNLGIVIKANKLADFKEVINKIIQKRNELSTNMVKEAK